MVIELIELFEGELHSDYIFLYFVLIGLEWDSITLFTKMRFFFFQNSPFTQYTYIYIYIYISHRKKACAKVSWAQTCNFIKKETLAQVLSCQLCEISGNTVYYKSPLVAASDSLKPF